MINLSGVALTDTILDPFCGSGTILAEAAVMGFVNLIASDVSAKAIETAKTNIKWIADRLEAKYPLPENPNFQILLNFQFYCADARKLDKIIKPKSIDAIITEPYLGKPLSGRETESFLREQANELKILYTAVMQTMSKILKPNGSIVMVVPYFEMRHKTISLDLTAAIKKAGLAAIPLLPNHISLRYHRPTQHLVREIWKFVKIESLRKKDTSIINFSPCGREQERGTMGGIVCGNQKTIK